MQADHARKILIACDTFKDALPAMDACRALRAGLAEASDDLIITLCPMADGGEGTGEVLAWHLGGDRVNVEATDPLGRPIEAHYFVSRDATTAFMDMATTSGLQLLAEGERNPMDTSTYGLGQMIAHAAGGGVRRIWLGIGGSATNDGGTGMACALGWRFLDAQGNLLQPTGRNLSQIARVAAPANAITGDCEVKVLCDVENILYGENGAAWVYGRQKGATRAEQQHLDAGLQHLASVIESQLGLELAVVPGGGAAGGLGAGAIAFLQADLCPGTPTMMDLIGFDALLGACDLVITGEGRLDAQTLQGKLIRGICQRAKTYEKPVVAFCGGVALTDVQITGLGLQAAFQITAAGLPNEEALPRTAELLTRAVRKWAVTALLSD